MVLTSGRTLELSSWWYAGLDDLCAERYVVCEREVHLCVLDLIFSQSW